MKISPSGFLLRAFFSRFFGSLRYRLFRTAWLANYFLSGGFRPWVLNRSKSWKRPSLDISAPPFPDFVDVLYVNLAHRTDRKLEIETELQLVGLFNANRFEGIRDPNGALGCGLSHLSILKNQLSVMRPIMILEDDVKFLVSREQLNIVVWDFLRRDDLDVLCLAFNIYNKPFRVSQYLGITNDTTGTACYLVKPHALERLISDFSSAVSLLNRGIPARDAAIDVVWKKTQQRHLIFSVPLIRTAVQRPSFSDVEKRFTDYGV